MEHKITGYYLVYNTFNFDKPDGVEKKIISQIDMFRDNGFDIVFHVLTKKNGSFWHEPEEIKNADFIYFRRGTIADLSFLNFFKKLKKINNKVVVFMEIPTFPYEDEYSKTLKDYLKLSLDHLIRKFLYRYIDRLIIVNNHNEIIWGIKVLNLVNGIDMKLYKPRQPRLLDDIIKIACVAKFSPWHGYERLIRGLKDYYNSNPIKEVKIIMVGTGIELDNYKQLVKDLNIEKYVDFRGQLIGQQLDDIYNECDIGCCSLGRYKSGIDMTSELKSREFMAKGLPMICGCKIDILEGVNYPYVIYFPNDDSDIDIAKVVCEYNKLISQTNESLIIESIRNYAFEYIDINKTYLPIVKEAKALCMK